jgi:hypothetical protein
LRHEFLNPAVAVEGFLEVGHLFRRHVTGDVATVLIALMVIIGALRALTKHADGAAVQALDLCDLVKEPLRSEF